MHWTPELCQLDLGILSTLTLKQVNPQNQEGNINKVFFLLSFHLTSYGFRSGGLRNSHLHEFYFTTSHNALKPRDVKSSKISLITWAHSTSSKVLYTQVVLKIIFLKMIYFCKVPGKKEKAYNHLILFVHHSPYDKVRRHLPKISVKSGCFQLLGSSAAPAITNELRHCWPQGGFAGNRWWRAQK